MAIGRRQTVTHAAAVILVPEGMIATVHNRDAANSADLGGKNVAAAAGYELKAGEVATIDARGENVWAIGTTADLRVDVLAIRGIN